MRLFTGLCNVVVWFVLFTFPVYAEDYHGETALIGFSGALSGASEAFGKSLANAVELAIAEANRNPVKIDGKKIFFRLLRMDDHGDNASAIRVANELARAGVIGVISTADSGANIAAAHIYAQAGIPQISASATMRDYTEQGYATIFRTTGSDDDAVRYLAKYVVKDLLASRIAIIDNDTVFGSGVAERFDAAVKVYGGTITSRTSINQMAMDFSDMLKCIKSQDVDAIFFGGYGPQTSILARNIRDMGMSARLVTSLIGLVGSSFLGEAGGAADGTVSQETGIPFSQMPGWKKFKSDYMWRFDSTIYGMTPFAYDAANVLIAAIHQIQSLDREQIVEALHQIVYKGLTGTIAFDAKGNRKNVAFTTYKVRDKKWIPLKTDVGP